MKKKLILALSVLTAGSAVTASAQMLIAAWDFSNGRATGSNTLSANYSDLYAGDGEATDAPAGMFYANGSYGSTIVDNSSDWTFGYVQGNSGFNSDVVTTSRPFSGDLDNDIDGPALSLSIADGTFTAGGAADASGATLVFAAFAPAGYEFVAGSYTFSYAIGNNNSTGNVVTLASSTDGIAYNAEGTDTVSSADELGESISITTLGGETGLFVSMTMPTLGWGSILLDNIQFVGAAPTATAVPEPSTVAALLGLLALGGAYIRRKRQS